MIRFKPLLFSFLLICAAHLMATGAMASVQDDMMGGILEVIGTGRIHGGDVAKARDEAIAQGLWDAVEKGVGQIISPSAVVSNFQLLSNRIYSRPEEFIHEYQVLTESKSRRHYRVVVRATVMMETLQDTLKNIGVLVADKALPDIVFILAEQGVGALGYNPSWGQDPFARSPLTTEETLDNVLTEKGFVVVRPGAPLRAEVEKPYDEGILPTDAEALSLGLQIEAEAVIIGKAESRFSGNVLGTDEKSIEATVQVRALRVDDGAVLGTFEATRVAVHADTTIASNEAFAAAATEVAENINKEISASGSRDTNRTLLVELIVQGIEAYGDFVRFRKVLKNEVRGIKNVYLKAIKAGEARMDIELQGSTRNLSQELMQKSFKGFGINIFEIGEKEIRLELIPKSSMPLPPAVVQDSSPEAKQESNSQW